jgi:hypothetical protein
MIDLDQAQNSEELRRTADITSSMKVRLSWYIVVIVSTAAVARACISNFDNSALGYEPPAFSRGLGLKKAPAAHDQMLYCFLHILLFLWGRLADFPLYPSPMCQTGFWQLFPA